MESRLRISAPLSRARAIASSDLPDAVGPRMTNNLHESAMTATGNLFRYRIVNPDARHIPLEHGLPQGQVLGVDEISLQRRLIRERHHDRQIEAVIHAWPVRRMHAAHADV